MKNFYRYEVVATHRNGRKIAPFTITNDRSENIARKAMKDAKADYPKLRIGLFARTLTNELIAVAEAT